MSYDYYGEDGCCLTCDESEEGCLCYSCKCSKCSELENHVCQHTGDWLTWDDYVEIAETVQAEGRKRFGSEPKDLTAIFSNGTITRRVFYANAIDIPTQIPHFLDEYPWKRTLLLKEIKLNTELGK